MHKSVLKAVLLFCLASVAACSGQSAAVTGDPSQAVPKTAKSLVVAGGCFWCVESDFEKKPGVYEAISGYSGGTKTDATYRDHAGHREVVEIFYDPAATDYETLVHAFLRTIDPTDGDGQFCDRGYEYTTAIHFRNEQEKALADAAVAMAATELGEAIATKVEPFTIFVKAEEYHQNYYLKNPVRYRLYRGNCGRDRRVKALWSLAAH